MKRDYKQTRDYKCKLPAYESFFLTHPPPTHPKKRGGDQKEADKISPYEVNLSLLLKDKGMFIKHIIILM